MKNLVWALCVMLGACTSIGGKPDTLVNDGGVSRSQAGANQDLYQAFNAAYYMSLCTTMQMGTSTNSGSEHSSTAHIRAVCSSLRQRTGEIAAAQQFANLGFVLAEEQCRQYFIRIANDDQNLDYFRQTTSLAGGVAVAAMQASNAAADTISNTALGFAALVSGMEIYDEAYHFSPSLHAVEQMIGDGMSDYRNKFNAIPDPDFHIAFSAISAFQSICQVSNIRSLVTSAVLAATVEAPVQTAQSSLAAMISVRARQALESRISALEGFENIGLSSYSTSLLYATYFGGLREQRELLILQGALSREGLTAAIRGDAEVLEITGDAAELQVVAPAAAAGTLEVVPGPAEVLREWYLVLDSTQQDALTESANTIATGVKQIVERNASDLEFRIDAGREAINAAGQDDVAAIRTALAADLNNIITLSDDEAVELRRLGTRSAAQRLGTPRVVSPSN